MNFSQIIILILILTFSAIAIKVSFSFDFNRYLENRRKIKMDQLKNICPHCKIEFVDKNQIKVTSYFSSPPGTYQWICSRCHCVVESEENAKRMGENYAKDPKKFLKNEKRFQKKVKKLGLC